MSGRGGKKSSHGRPPKDKRHSQKGKGKDEASYAHLKGCLVVVELAQGIYEAVFHGTHKNPTGELILTFRHAQKQSEGEVNPNPNPFLAVLEATDAEVRDLKVVKQPPSQSQSQSQPQSQPQSDLKPKSSPNRSSPGPGAGGAGGGGASGSGKELQPWRPDEGEAQGGEALLEDLLKASRMDGERWIEEQFQKRETTFDMNNYTTALDKSSEFYKQHEERATKIAQEILSSQSDSAHVLSDRGQNVSVDEADLFSDVSADHASHNSAPTSTSAVGGTRGRKKDVPKARGQGFLSDKEISQRQRRDPPRGLNARNLLPQSPTHDSQTSTTNAKQADAKSSTSTSSASSTTSGVSSSTSAAPASSTSSLASSTSLSAASSASTSTTASHSESVSHTSLSKTQGNEKGASNSQDSKAKVSGDKQSGQDAKQSGEDAKQSGEDAKQGAEDAKQGGEDAKGGQEAKAPEEKPKSKFKFNPKASTFLSRSAAEFVPSAQPPLPGPGTGAAPPPMFDGQWAPAPYSHPPEMSYQPGLTEGYHPQYHYAPPPVHMGMPPSPGMVAVPVPMSVPMPVPRVVMAPSPYSGYPPQGHPMY